MGDIINFEDFRTRSSKGNNEASEQKSKRPDLYLVENDIYEDYLRQRYFLNPLEASFLYFLSDCYGFEGEDKIGFGYERSVSLISKFLLNGGRVFLSSYISKMPYDNTKEVIFESENLYPYRYFANTYNINSDSCTNHILRAFRVVFLSNLSDNSSKLRHYLPSREHFLRNGIRTGNRRLVNLLREGFEKGKGINVSDCDSFDDWNASVYTRLT